MRIFEELIVADDARTEARRRLVEVLAAHRWVGASCACGERLPVGIAEHLAGVVLALFPTASWTNVTSMGAPTRHERSLTLGAALEPVMPLDPTAEEPTDA